MVTVTTRRKVRHRNELNQTLLHLNLCAKRILMIIMSGIDSKSEIKPRQTFRVHAEEYAAMTGLSKRTAYDQMRDGADILSTSNLYLYRDEIKELAGVLDLPYTEKNLPSSLKLSITDFCSYFDDEGYIEVRFSNTVQPYISKISGEQHKFTTQVLISSIRLSSMYSTALYQLIRKNHSSNKFKNTFTITVDDLKKELGAYVEDENGSIEYKYTDYPKFNQNVIKPAIKDILKKTEVVSLEVATKKIGRKVSALTFTFKLDEKSLIEKYPEIESHSEEAIETIENVEDEKGGAKNLEQELNALEKKLGIPSGFRG